MYHGIREDRGTRLPYFETNTSLKMFRAQMQFLRDRGYKAISLSEALQHISIGNVNNKHVVITFDDGYRDLYTAALPVLSHNAFTATVFVVSSFPTTTPDRFASEEFMTWNQIREVHSCGIEIGSHTVSHPELWTLNRRELEYELIHSKKTIEDALGQAVRAFSHPFAFPEHDTHYSEALVSLLKQYGYENGVSTIIGTAGPAHSRHLLPRLPINLYDDVALFAAKLEGAYDWMHMAQWAYKSWLKPHAPVASSSVKHEAAGRKA
jgi:peptidoglycan/xylan/chitin deacetylase (PgdA/CDA1 family)